MSGKPHDLEDAIEKAFESYVDLLNDIDSSELADNLSARILRHFDVLPKESR